MILDHKIQVFLQVARAEGFRRAARGLGLSQSAVSFHIDKLEEELGVRLFHRQGRTISLTSEGIVLFQELELLERAARQVEDKFAYHSNMLGRRIRVGSNAIACPFTLPWVIQAFKHTHADVLFTYRHVTDEQELVSFLEDGDLDLGIIGHPIRNKRIHLHTCYESDIILVGTEALGWERVDLEGLKDIPLIFENSDRGLELLLSKGLGDVGVQLSDLDIVIESDNLSLIKTFVQAGLGAAFLPRVAIRDELCCGSFHEIAVESLELKQDILLASLKSGPSNRITAEFVDFVENHIREVVPILD